MSVHGFVLTRHNMTSNTFCRYLVSILPHCLRQPGPIYWTKVVLLIYRNIKHGQKETDHVSLKKSHYDKSFIKSMKHCTNRENLFSQFYAHQLQFRAWHESHVLSFKQILAFNDSVSQDHISNEYSQTASQNFVVGTTALDL